MFSRKKPAPAKRRNHDLSQFGITEIPDDFDPTGGVDGDNDSDLEAELAAITGDSNKVKRKPKAALLPNSELDKMVAESLREIASDEDDGDVNDPDLLGELQTITGNDVENVETEHESEEVRKINPTSPQLYLPTTTVDTISVIKQRIEMYQQAEIVAKASGEAAKARRFTRGIKTLMDLLKQASSGRPVNIEDIPPEVSVKPSAPEPKAEETVTATPAVEPAPILPIRSAPPPPVPVVSLKNDADDSIAKAEPSNAEVPENLMLTQMYSRQAEYKKAALQSKRVGDTATALQFLKVVKQFDMVIKMCKEGKEVDLSDMPPPPEEFLQFMAQMQAASATTPATTDVPTIAPVVVTEERTSETATPSTLLEALQQRLEKYKSVEESAKAEGNSSKARRFGRIVKQYEDAIKCNKAGRTVVYDELPIPPGFGPLPTEDNAVTNQGSAKVTSPSASSTRSDTISAETTPPNPTPTVNNIATPPRQELTTRTSGNQQKNNLAEQQMKILLDRQREYKVAAVDAKKAGEIEQAKEYLKIYKGFDALLNAASSGLPVDLQTLPLSPSQRDNLEASFAIVTTEECDPDNDIADISIRVEEQLAKQLMMCKNTRDHHKAMGDIAGMNRFENIAITVQKDLDLVRYSKRKNFPLPKFHYENRSFNIVHCNTDLTDNELEIVVVRGINYNVMNPKEVDTYVRIEFPLLNDESFKTKTTLVKDTDSPDYDQHFKVDIQRNNRQFQRIFKRHGVKFEVYSRGGFLRSDILIGTINVKLQPLETKCDIHDTFDLMEGRKASGGKLEIKIRVRNPILTKQIEHINEKWLVLDA